MFTEPTREELAAALDTVTEEMLLGVGVRLLPVDAFALAEKLGITVAFDAQQASRARYVRLRPPGGGHPQPTIFLRPDPRPERLHWAIAHEIGEHLVPRLGMVLGVDGETWSASLREMLANQLAARLLLPTAWFQQLGSACGWDLLALKRHCATASHELIVRRMLDCPPPVIVSIFDHGCLMFRRSNVSGRVPPPSPAEERCWRAAHRGKSPAQAHDSSLTIRCWAIHEPNWRREIMRTEPADW
jgi:hypothetical protein